MAITFLKGSRSSKLPSDLVNTAYLQPDNWDDYSYKTLFYLTIFDDRGQQYQIGSVKIGFLGQGHGRTEDYLEPKFVELSDVFFSLGQDANYYKELMKVLTTETRNELLVGLKDVVNNSELLAKAKEEGVFKDSLLRTIRFSIIDQQFQRILNNAAALTDYEFIYQKEGTETSAGLRLEFTVTPDSNPPTNIHILIGRNGVGKTTILNNMVDCLVERESEEDLGTFITPLGYGMEKPMPLDYFTGLVSVSFSAFDVFAPPDDQKDDINGILYSYIGLKSQTEDNQWVLKTKDDLCKDFSKSIGICFALPEKRHRWRDALKKLESDDNFAEMELCRLIDLYLEDNTENRTNFKRKTAQLFRRMSSGHAIVLLTITKLIEKVEEKTLILIDEPESHLHPPLLSAFTRALSDLLTNRNGVAIIATHSPVVLQEVPKSCVSIIRRTRLISKVDPPTIETFGENVGILTREVFGLEVNKSGFYEVLESMVAQGKTFEDIDVIFNGQIGFEGKAIIQSLILNRNSQLD